MEREIKEMEGNVFWVEKQKRENSKESSEEFNQFFVFSDGPTAKYLTYHLSVSILGLANEIIKAKGIQSESLSINEVIIRISVAEENSRLLINVIKEVAELRSSNKVSNLGKVNIIRQLPWKIAVQESNYIAEKGIWHAIYDSSRGGYNIKVAAPYENPSLDRYCCHDSGVWDGPK